MENLEDIVVIDFGLNTDKFSGKAWDEKVEEFKNAVETYGVARARWGCDGRTRHYTNGEMLKEALPQYRFTLGYNSYLCVAIKGQEVEK